jgi:hypothetical protein
MTTLHLRKIDWPVAFATRFSCDFPLGRLAATSGSAPNGKFDHTLTYLKAVASMKRIAQFFLILVSICVLALVLPARGETDAFSVTVVTTFDFPGAGNSTFTYGINKKGDIAGYYLDSSGVTRGYVRRANGTFIGPIVDPGDTGGFTRALAINSSGVVGGDYLTISDNALHGFFLTGRTYTPYDFPGTSSSDIFAMNDAGNFGGFGVDIASGTDLAYVNIGGVVSMFTVAGATLASTHGMNSSNQAVGFYSTDGSVTFHGFLRDAGGTITSPIDFPGAQSTTLQGINTAGIIVGRYNNADGVIHGFVAKLPHTFISFDYPGATQTSLNDINDRNLISARYTDGAGVAHGFIAQLTR